MNYLNKIFFYKIILITLLTVLLNSFQMKNKDFKVKKSTTLLPTLMSHKCEFAPSEDLHCSSSANTITD